MRPLSIFCCIILLILMISGIIFNLLVILITIYKRKELNKFKWFIVTLAAYDMTYCTYVSILVPYHVSFANPLEDETCYIQGYILFCVAMCTITVLPLLSLNRWVSLYRSTQYYMRLYQPWKIATMIVCSAIVAWLTYVPLFMAGYSGHLPGHDLCVINLGENLHNFALFVVTVGPVISVAYSVSIYCNYKIYRKLKIQQEVLQTFQQKERIAKNKELVKVAIFWTIAPLVCLMPSLVLMTALKKAVTNQLVLKVADLMFMSNSVWNPLATLYAVTPYRSAIVGLCKGLKQGSLTFTNPPVNQAAVAQMNVWAVGTRSEGSSRRTQPNRRSNENVESAV